MDPSQFSQPVSPEPSPIMQPQDPPMDTMRPPELTNPPESGVPGDMSGSQMITPQQKQVLLDMITKIKAKIESIDAMKFASEEQLEVIRQNIMKQVFEKLQQAGVDLSDQQAVAEFMTNLKNTTPDLAMAFEQAIETILTEGPGGQQDPNAPTLNQGAGPDMGMSGNPAGMAGPGMDQSLPPMPPGSGIPGMDPNNMNMQNPNESLLKG